MSDTDQDDPQSDRWNKSAKAKALRAAGASAAAYGQQMMSNSRDEAASHIGPVSYKGGGRVKKTGLARLHKGEYVVPTRKVKRVKKAMRRMKSSRRS